MFHLHHHLSKAETTTAEGGSSHLGPQLDPGVPGDSGDPAFGLQLLFNCPFFFPDTFTFFFPKHFYFLVTQKTV